MKKVVYVTTNLVQCIDLIESHINDKIKVKVKYYEGLGYEYILKIKIRG